PSGFSQSAEMQGHFSAATVKRAFGCAAGSFFAGVQSRWRQSIACFGFGPSIPSHHTPPSSVNAQLVKMTSSFTVAIAAGFDCDDVPGATPKKPLSGLIARSLPSGPIFIHAMSSPMVSLFQPGIVGTSMARLVLPQADGNAAAM